jgi:tRNA modification GTPase
MEPNGENPTFIALLTPAGRGAVATLGVRGPRAIAIVATRFAAASGQPLATFAVGQVVFGRLAVGEGVAEELVIGLVGPREVEIHCHGGQAAAKAVADALTGDGAVRIDWHEWARTGERDLIAAEATIALAEATTERTAAILLDQYRGAFAAALARGDDPAALLARADLGRHLTRPWQVVLCGRPNVGKSSLINALLGYARAIVHDQPGTTRDVLSAAAAFGGWPVELADTAGLRASESPIETAGVARAREQIAAADLLLLVTDAASAWTAADENLWREVQQLARPECRRIAVHNKCDLTSPPADGRPAGIAVSATATVGMEELEKAIAAALVPNPPPPSAAVPFTERQFALLRAAANLSNS